MALTLKDISTRLSLEIVDKCFKKKTNSEDSVKTVVVSRGAPAGEGLISAVYRIHVTGSSHRTTFIVKTLVSDPLLRRSLPCHGFFEREVLFFSEVLPQFSELQKSLGAKENIQRHIPICYSYYIGNDEDYLVLEDLAESSCESIKDPSKHEMNLILRILAHVHAVSMALREYKLDVFADLAKKMRKEAYYTKENREWFAKYLQNAIKIDKQALREFEPESSIYYKKFLQTVDSDPYGQLINLTSYSGDYPTINHGDAWLPNFMYSKARVVAIDFQVARCVSVVTDLTFFLVLCSNLCSTKETFYEALNLYYSFLDYYLADMGLNVKSVFPREVLEMEMKKYGKFGLMAALTTIPLIANSEKCDVATPFQERFADIEKIPLEVLWPLVPMTKSEHKMRLVNAVRVAVDAGLM